MKNNKALIFNFEAAVTQSAIDGERDCPSQRHYAAVEQSRKLLSEALEHTEPLVRVSVDIGEQTVGLYINLHQAERLHKGLSEVIGAGKSIRAQTDGTVTDLINALKTAINTVECASIDPNTREELPWYRQAKAALTKAGVTI